jgi:hypothetical protein
MLSINGTPITKVASTKFLGVHVDQHLSWKEHINAISNKIAKNVGILSRTSYLLPTSIRLKLYFSLVYPYLTYCNMVWASTYPSRLQRLVILQKRAVRTIAGVPRGSHTKPIFSSLRLLNLEQILTLQTSIFMFRYEHKLLPLCFQGYFHLASDIHTHYTRGSNSYRSISARTNTRLFSIKCVGPKIWNMLPARLRLAPHLRKFKKELHKYLIDGN